MVFVTVCDNMSDNRS